MALKIKLPWVYTCMYLSDQQLVKPQNDLSANLYDWKAEVQLGLSDGIEWWNGTLEWNIGMGLIHCHISL